MKALLAFPEEDCTGADSPNVLRIGGAKPDHSDVLLEDLRLGEPGFPRIDCVINILAPIGDSPSLVRVYKENIPHSGVGDDPLSAPGRTPVTRRQQSSGVFFFR